MFNDLTNKELATILKEMETDSSQTSTSDTTPLSKSLLGDNVSIRLVLPSLYRECALRFMFQNQ